MRVNLKLAFLRSGKTQRQIASDTGIPENRVSELVRGWAVPRDDEREALAKALNESDAHLFAPTPSNELHKRGVLDGLQQAIVHASAIGDLPLIDDIGTVKVRAARRFSGSENQK